MSYTAKMSPIQAETLGPIIPRIEALRPNEILTLTDASPESTERLRSWIYGWMFLSNLKPYYRVRKISPTSLVILRLPIPAPRIETEGSEVSDYVRDHMLEIGDEQSALDHLRCSGREPAFILAALNEWKRVMGVEE